jgi:hypothetical protein
VINDDSSNKLVVTPGDYPPPKLNQLLSDLVGALQAYLAGALFLANKQLPKQMRESRILSAMVLWFGGSLVRSGMTKTGAFEVYLGDKLVFSAIKNGGDTPKMKDILEAFKAAGVTLKQKTRA